MCCNGNQDLAHRDFLCLGMIQLGNSPVTQVSTGCEGKRETIP